MLHANLPRNLSLLHRFNQYNLLAVVVIWLRTTEMSRVFLGLFTENFIKFNYQLPPTGRGLVETKDLCVWLRVRCWPTAITIVSNRYCVVVVALRVRDERVNARACAICMQTQVGQHQHLHNLTSIAIELSHYAPSLIGAPDDDDAAHLLCFISYCDTSLCVVGLYSWNFLWRTYHLE